MTEMPMKRCKTKWMSLPSDHFDNYEVKVLSCKKCRSLTLYPHIVHDDYLLEDYDYDYICYKCEKEVCILYICKSCKGKAKAENILRRK